LYMTESKVPFFAAIKALFSGLSRSYMKYINTRNKSQSVSGARAIISGIGENSGLFVPEQIPKISFDEIKMLAEQDYCYRAAYIMHKYLDEFKFDELLEFSKAAYKKFSGDAAPLIKIDENLYILELWHGPTLAFKDVALTMLPYLLVKSKEKNKDKTHTLILVATSGDTGKAALEGFKDIENTSIIVFYPTDGVSSMQKLQMMTQDGKNVGVFGVKGNFDDCQTAVKNIFADAKINKEFKAQNIVLSSANSINWGRLLPQIVYYISAYVDLVSENQIEMGDKINFSVPTGNFGDILAGWYAYKMGLPVNKLICASNSNNVLTDFFNKGEYNAKRELIRTMSPSMNILISSNLERLVFENSERDDSKTLQRFSDLKEKSYFRISEEELIKLKQVFFGAFCPEDDTIEEMEYFFEEYGYPLDPHTSVAAYCHKKYRKQTEDKKPTVILATANPYKFPQDVVYALTGDDVKDSFRACKKLHAHTAMEVPLSIVELKDKPKRFEEVIKKDEILDTVRSFVQKIKK